MPLALSTQRLLNVPVQIVTNKGLKKNCNWKYQDQATGEPSTLLISNYNCDSHTGVFTNRFYSLSARWRKNVLCCWQQELIHFNILQLFTLPAVNRNLNPFASTLKKKISHDTSKGLTTVHIHRKTLPSTPCYCTLVLHRYRHTGLPFCVTWYSRSEYVLPASSTHAQNTLTVYKMSSLFKPRRRMGGGESYLHLFLTMALDADGRFATARHWIISHFRWIHSTPI